MAAGDNAFWSDVADVPGLVTVPAWTTYTPAWTATTTNPVIGNGTITGAYSRHGSEVHLRIVVTVGSTTTVGSGVYSLSLPVGGKVNSLLTVMYVDDSAGARYSGTCQLISTSATGSNMRMNVAGGTGVVGATIPVVPATADILMISGTYEAN